PESARRSTLAPGPSGLPLAPGPALASAARRWPPAGPAPLVAALRLRWPSAPALQWPALARRRSAAPTVRSQAPQRGPQWAPLWAPPTGVPAQAGFPAPQASSSTPAARQPP